MCAPKAKIEESLGSLQEKDKGSYESGIGYYMCGTVESFTKTKGNLHGLEFVLPLYKEKRGRRRMRRSTVVGSRLAPRFASTPCLLA